MPRASRKGVPSVIRTESGFYSFNKTQAFLRFSLCREALSQKKRFTVKYKHIYQEGTIAEQYAVPEFAGAEVFNAIYNELLLLGWGSRFYNYDKRPCAEGSFYPFIRYSGHKAKNVVDQGCIWIGGRSVYPRIYLDNHYANWFKPINRSGHVRLKPFLPLGEIQTELMKLRNRKIIQSLTID